MNGYLLNENETEREVLEYALEGCDDSFKMIICPESK